MNILVTCHVDSNFTQNELKVSEDEIIGTLDNLVGVMALSRFWKYLKEHNVDFIYTENEEAGQGDSKYLASTYDPENTIVINLDIDEIDNINVACQLDNINGFNMDEIEDLKEYTLYYFPKELVYNIPTNFYEDVKDNPDFQDDSWSFAKKGFRVFTLTCPVQGNFHSTDCKISINAFDSYCRCLEATLKYFIDERENAD